MSDHDFSLDEVPAGLDTPCTTFALTWHDLDFCLSSVCHEDTRERGDELYDGGVWRLRDIATKATTRGDMTALGISETRAWTVSRLG